MSAKDNNAHSQGALILFLMQGVLLCWQNDPVYIKEKVHYYLVSQIFCIIQDVKHTFILKEQSTWQLRFS